MTKKRCLILSYGPVPTPEHDKVEGGGLRCWGLAKGLRANDDDLQVTVAYKDEFKKPDFTASYEGVDLAVWSMADLPELISDFDTVIVSYCMGDLSNEAARLVRSDQQLVLDCYVPIYVEISARESADLAGEYAAFSHEVGRWADVLKRGDVFLCANENQKRFYQGVLAGLGRVNPATYNDDMILVVPYGIYREKPQLTDKPISKLLGEKTRDKSVRRLLWFGAIYPWFDLRELVDAVELLNKTVPTKLIIVGARNPFNGHPDFIHRYQELMGHIEGKSQETRDNIVMQDWAKFDERANWYLESDLVILINKIGPENELAWRTRLVDFIWADLPIVTNGGDPLGEALINEGAAARLEHTDAQGMAAELGPLLVDDKKLNELKRNLSAQRETYYWDTVTKKLQTAITESRRPRDITEFGLLETLYPTPGSRTVVKRVVNKAKKIPAYYKKHGARSTYYTLRTTLMGQKRRLGITEGTGPSRVVFVSHQLDNTGGPLVLLELVKDFRHEFPKVPVAFHTFGPAKSNNILRLNKYGIKPNVYMTREIGLTFNQGDVVVLNTVAYSELFRTSLYESLWKGVVKHLIWYIHEDEPDLIFSSHELAEIRRLLKAGKLTIYTPAQHSTQNYQKHLQNTKDIHVQYYRLQLPEELHETRTAEQFDQLDFVLPGMVGDGRKGQLPVFYALSVFKKNYYDKDPEKYRNFTLTFVGMTKDFYSRQMMNHYENALGSHFRHHEPLPHNETLDIIKASNITICYSLRECLPIFVFEGMAAGHPVLRNECSGSEEQLHEGKNGLMLDNNDFYQLISTFERLLNKATTSNEQLLAMSRESQKIEREYEKKGFANILSEIKKQYQ